MENLIINRCICILVADIRKKIIFINRNYRNSLTIRHSLVYIVLLVEIR